MQYYIREKYMCRQITKTSIPVLAHENILVRIARKCHLVHQYDAWVSCQSFCDIRSLMGQKLIEHSEGELTIYHKLYSGAQCL